MEAEAAVITSRRVAFLGVAIAVALLLIALGTRSIDIAESSRLLLPIAAIPLFVAGVWLPLLGLIYAVSRRRAAVVALAFLVGLSTNLVFLSHAVPAAAVTDNSNVFTFARTTAYGSPMFDMNQNYTPSGGQAFCPVKYGNLGGYDWTCRFLSDQFSAGQTLNAGTATTDLYLENDNPSPTLVAASGFGAGSASSIAVNKPAGVASGDVLIAAIAIRGGTNVGAITKPSASWTLLDRIDSVTALTLNVYSLVAGGSEPASYTWSWSSGNQKSAGFIQAFRGVDTATPIDAHAGQSESVASASTHTAPSVTATYGNEMGVLVFADASNWLCSGLFDYQLDAQLTSTGGGSGTSDVTINGFHSYRFLPPGPTGTVTGSCGNNDIGATAHVALRSAAGAALTCTLTTRLKLLTTIQPVGTTTATLNNGLSLSINVPGGVVAGDFLLATVGKTGSEYLGIPSGWTRIDHVGDASTMDYSVLYHVVQNGDPSSYAFSWTGSTNRYGVGGITAYRNVDNDNPVDVQGTWGSGNASPTSFPAPSVTTTVANEMIVTAYGVAANNPGWTPPTGMTERLDLVNGTGTTFVSVEQDDVLQTASGATGTLTATSSVGGGGGAITVALRPGKLLGSGTDQITGPTAATLASSMLTTSAVTFAAGDQLELEVIAPNDATNCATWLSYDGGSQPSKLTLATIVPEGVGGLLLLAPALPFGARWWKRRRP